MEKDKFLKTIENIEHKSNKDLYEAEEFLFKQHEELKNLIIDLTVKLEKIEEIYESVVKEIENRKVK